MNARRTMVGGPGAVVLFPRRHTGRTRFSMAVASNVQEEEVQKVWSYRDYAVYGTPAGTPVIGFDSTIYVGGDDGILHAINGSTGEKRWIYQASGYDMFFCARVCVRVRAPVRTCVPMVAGAGSLRV